MIQRRKPLVRKTPLARSTTPIPRVSKRRRREKRSYRSAEAVYLEKHPLCQITIARLGLDEESVLAAYALSRWNDRLGDPFAFTYQGNRIPYATEVHHRNKCRGARLNDERWWISAGRAAHDAVENDKKKAREEGFLLPINADAEGRSPGGRQDLTTPAFMDCRRVGMPAIQWV